MNFCSLDSVRETLVRIQFSLRILVFDQLCSGAHAAILKWVEANGYQLLEQYREIYIVGPNENSGESTTEVQFVVKRNG